MKQIILIASIVLLLGAAALCFIIYQRHGAPNDSPKPHVVVAAGTPESGPTNPTRRLYYLLFDQSLSLAANCQTPPAGNEQPEWRKAGEQIVQGLEGGDSILILGVHGSSHTAAPIYRGDMPVLPEDATYEIEEQIREKWAEIRRDARAAVAAALNPPKRDTETDIFGALNRVRPGKDQETRIYIFSDSKESTPVLDLEHMRLTEKNLLPSLKAAISKYDWQEDQLRAAKVCYLLDSVELGCRPTSPNDRTMLRRFWESFFQSFKAELVTFETHLPPGHFERGNQAGGAIDEDE